MAAEARMLTAILLLLIILVAAWMSLMRGIRIQLPSRMIQLVAFERVSYTIRLEDDATRAEKAARERALGQERDTLAPLDPRD